MKSKKGSEQSALVQSISRRFIGRAISDLLDAARGRWLDILADAGIERAKLDGHGYPCPVCEEGTDRFAAFPDVNDRGAVHCRYCFTAGTDPCPSDGLATIRWRRGLSTGGACQWLAAWLATNGVVVCERNSNTYSRRIRIKPDLADHMAKYAAMADRFRCCLHEWVLNELAAQLQLPTNSLVRMGVGYSLSQHATTWPMRDGVGDIVGIRLRSLTTDRKWSVAGSLAGVFVPDELPDNLDRLFIAEGPSDTSALLLLGLNAIGRPSASGAVATVCETVTRLNSRECVVMADQDLVGQKSATELCSRLQRCCGRVRMVTPPHGYKDVRDWVITGARLLELERIVEAASPAQLTLKRGCKK